MTKYKGLQNHISKKSNLINLYIYIYIYIYRFKLNYKPYRIHKYFSFETYFEHFFDKSFERKLTTLLFLNFFYKLSLI